MTKAPQHNRFFATLTTKRGEQYQITRQKYDFISIGDAAGVWIENHGVYIAMDRIAYIDLIK